MEKGEQQSVAIAKVVTDIGYIKEAINRIEDRLDALDRNYVRRDDADRRLAESVKIHADFEERLRAVEDNTAELSTQFKTYGTIGVILLGIVQFLISYFR